MTGFLPAPESLRCAAVIYRIGSGFSRCPKRHEAGSDLCPRHLAMERAGQLVQRVKAPRRVGA